MFTDRKKGENIHVLILMCIFFNYPQTLLEDTLILQVKVNWTNRFT